MCLWCSVFTHVWPLSELTHPCMVVCVPVPVQTTQRRQFFEFLQGDAERILDQVWRARQTLQHGVTVAQLFILPTKRHHVGTHVSQANTCVLFGWQPSRLFLDALRV